jgi:UDP-N-acetylglucosamine 2-epimerase
MFNKLIKNTAMQKGNFYYFATLGIERYLKLLSVSDLVVGNSSSGLHEAPSLRVPTLDIGLRQSGRTRGGSVINVAVERDLIIEHIKDLLSNSESLCYENPYISDRDSSMLIYEKVKEAVGLDVECAE